MGFRLIVIFSAISFCLSGCKNEPKMMLQKDIPEAKKTFAKINKVLIDQDRKLIEGYIKRHQLENMKETGTGLFYIVWGESKGDLIKTGNIVEYTYKVTLLDGTLCYQTDSDHPKKFQVGHGGVESGLEQAVLLMKQGQKGKFILPPHLAYGLQGDWKKIPSRSIIVYDVEMLNVYR